MMMTQKALFLGLGVSVALAGSLSAGERHRGSDTTVPDGAAAMKADFKVEVLEPGVGLVKANGQEFKLYANGQVMLDEALTSFGSVDNYNFALSTLNSPKATSKIDGSTVYASGAVVWTGETAAASNMQPEEPQTLADFQARTQWVEQDFGGTNVMVLANGAVFADESLTQQVPSSLTERGSAPSMMDASGNRVYATGAVYLEESSAATR